jgi:hypothetical protein
MFGIVFKSRFQLQRKSKVNEGQESEDMTRQLTNKTSSYLQWQQSESSTK